MLKVILTIFLLFAHANCADELSFKDNFKSTLTTFLVSTYFQSRGYGTVDVIKYDTERKKLYVELSPEGERQKLNISVEKIDFLQEKDGMGFKYFLVLNRLSTNRIWLNRILADSNSAAIKIPISEQNYNLLSAVL